MCLTARPRVGGRRAVGRWYRLFLFDVVMLFGYSIQNT